MMLVLKRLQPRELKPRVRSLPVQTLLTSAWGKERKKKTQKTYKQMNADEIIL